ncbi:hypothetical protein TWF506_009239 [Arthrobotrys conoides]|uniref:AAA+ ATPase domain-containing protein n=1 Tax=Arthrobotrys conoides TaxID=74498 RepID=A0AAN8NI85_9PEZI
MAHQTSNPASPSSSDRIENAVKISKPEATTLKVTAIPSPRPLKAESTASRIDSDSEQGSYGWGDRSPLQKGNNISLLDSKRRSESTTSPGPEFSDHLQSDLDPDEYDSSTSDSEDDDDILRHLKKSNSSHLRKFGDCIINPNDIHVTFDDVHITPDAIEALDPLLLQIQFPEQFRTGILARNTCTGLLLYGPPGTGKTLFVKALAKMANATMISLTGADFQDCRVGESQKKVQELFACARAHDGPVVIFIDEADGPFRSRAMENTTHSHASEIGQFLVEMDGIKSHGNLNIMIVAAANRPFDMDEGILRRFSRRILVDTPTPSGREAILRIHLRDEQVSDDVDLGDLARRTADFTGSDLKNLVFEATLATLRDIYVLTRDGDYAGDMYSRMICHRHFSYALEKIQPSPKSEIVEKIHQFHSKFGSRSQRRPNEAPEKYQLPLKKRKLDVRNK